MHGVWQVLVFAASTCVALLVATAPARAGYCEDQYHGIIPGIGARPVVGSCRSVRVFVIDGPTGPTTLELLTDGNVEIAPARLTVLIGAIGEIARRVGPRLRDLGGYLGLPPRINLVIVTGSNPATADANAETFPISTQSSSDATRQCPQLLYNSGLMTAEGLQRTLSHEIFHCAHEQTLERQMRQAGHEWWAEGSAEWFEDFVFPEHYRFSNTNVAVLQFQRLSAEMSMLNMRYGMVVFFSWLHRERGARAVGEFLTHMAGPGTTQLAAARAALPEDAWNDFAHAYVDEQITLPSGTRVTGPKMPQLAMTTGEPGADPDVTRATPEPMTLMRGTVDVVPGGYGPKGDYGGKERVFSERSGEWNKLPEKLEVKCGEKRTFRFAAVSTAERPATFKFKPGTEKAVQCGECGATGGSVRRSGCVVGSWHLMSGSGGNCEWLSNFATDRMTMTPEVCEPGNATVSFNRDGTFEGMVTNAKRRVTMTFASRRGGPTPSMTFETIIRLAKSTGLWSAREETANLKLCHTMTVGEGEMKMRGADPLSGESRENSQAMRFGPMETVDFQYSCSGNAMTVTYTPPGKPSFGFKLERVGPPAGDTPPSSGH